MAWKRSRGRPGDSVIARPPSPSPDLDRLVDEGMMIARSALRMSAKNHLIVAALRSPDDFDEAALLERVRDDAAALAEEKDTEAGRLEGIAGKAAKRSGRASFHDDYRRQDVRALGLREQVNTEMARRLRALVEADEDLRELLSVARESALDDMLQARLVAAIPFHLDPDYLVERGQRLETLTRDLSILYRRQKARLGDRID